MVLPLLLAFAGLAGCTSDEDEGDGGETEPLTADPDEKLKNAKKKQDETWDTVVKSANLKDPKLKMKGFNARI